MNSKIGVGNCLPFFINSKLKIMKVRFGMLMTDAVGKAGGQCVQRFRGTSVLRNITQPIQSQKAKKNKQRYVVTSLARFWRSISPEARVEWIVIGQKIETTNTWGDIVRLSGRQAFFSLNSLYFSIHGVIVSPFVVSEIKPVISFTSIRIQKSYFNIVKFGASSPDTIYYEWKYERLRNATSYVDVRKQKRFGIFLVTASDDQIYDALQSFNDKLQFGQFYGISLRGVSASGVASTWQTFVSQVT